MLLIGTNIYIIFVKIIAEIEYTNRFLSEKLPYIIFGAERRMLEEDIDILKRIFAKNDPLKCPECGSFLIVIELPPSYGPHGIIVNAYLECPKCGFKKRVNTFTVYGAVRDYTENTVEIGSWSETGGREINTFHHILSEKLLGELKESQDLVEFLIVDDTIIAVIG